MNSTQEIVREVETAAISGLAAASKTPFMTAFKITLGIGLGRLVLFVGFVTTIVIAVKLLS